MRLTDAVVLLTCAVVFVAAETSTERRNEVSVEEKQANRPPTSLDHEDLGDSATHKSKADISFYHGFIAALSVIIVSELGDRTWFIAIIMSMRNSRLTVFCGAMAALALMHVLSACLGWATQIIPHSVTYWVSTALFAIFGLKMLHEGYHMSSNEAAEEFEEAQAEVAKRELDLDSQKFIDMESGKANRSSNSWLIFSFMSRIFIEAFSLTFVAEWGDRSQLTTIILGARENIPGVIIGGILGHAICTGIAVVGGKLVAQRISIRTVTLIGGIVFIGFALSALFIRDNDEMAAVATPDIE